MAKAQLRFWRVAADREPKRSPLVVIARAMLGGVLSAVVFFLLPASVYAEPPSIEYQVKAAFLYKFADYIDWPPSAFDSASSVFGLCVVGNDPFGHVLDDLVAGERIGGRPIAVRRLATVSGDSGCHILFAAGPNARAVIDALHTVAGEPVLTVTDGFDETGPHGIINFIIRDNHVRFDIDEVIAAESGLAISSKLLSLSATVRSRADGKRQSP